MTSWKSIASVPDHFFRDLVETMNEAVWVGDENERTVYANPKFCELMEYSLEEMIGRESYDFWDHESAETVRKTNAWKRKQWVRSSYEWLLLSKSGKKVPVLLSGSPVPGGGTVGIMTDMREYKRLQKKEKAISQAVSMANDCIFSYSSNGKVTSWNKWAKTIFGYKLSEIGEDGIRFLFPDEILSNFQNSVDNYSQIRFRWLDKQKNTLVLSGIITPIIYEWESHPSEYLFIGRDITRQINIEEQIDKHCVKIKDAYTQIWLLQRQLDYIQDIIKFWKGKNWSHMTFYDFILRSILFISDSELVHFWKCDTSGNMMLSGSMGKVQLFPTWTKKKYSKSATEYAILQWKSVKIIEPEKHGEFDQFSPIKPHHNIYGVMLIPLWTPENPFWVIEIYVSEKWSLDLFESSFIEDYVSAIELVIKSSPV